MKIRGTMEHNGDGNGMEQCLFEAVRNRLAVNGGLGKIRSELRAMVIKDVRQGDESPFNYLDSKGAISPTQIANYLVLEYLEWIRFQYSLDMFATESGNTNVRARELVESKVGIKDGQFDKELPLLMTMTMNLIKDTNNERKN